MRKGIGGPWASYFPLAARLLQTLSRFPPELVDLRSGAPSGSVSDRLSGIVRDCALAPEPVHVFPKPGKTHFVLLCSDHSGRTRKRSEWTFPQCKRYGQRLAGPCLCCPRRTRPQYENCARPSGLGHLGLLPIRIFPAPALLPVQPVSLRAFESRHLE